ncbi:C40 family peptidase [Planobispora longispora]|uniref:NlpC/P60 domain-containing protein n=1 Tax=Planobispora longispora TaxID=28887 RepID=A0A8J3W9A1_9ACTN|nr:C40 family peptidase [Planobispora longispora]BFE88659.1 hypothetical protein GCM10020093_112600 [Planobispora longispora]GIH81514.1 hypothetical protein Plo01_79430 [Planobispora longispora]
MTASAGAVTLGATQARATTDSTTAVPVRAIAGAAASATVNAKVSAKMTRAARQKERAARAVSTAKRKVGAPYRWGASGPGAFDCSGLVQYSWRAAGVKLPRITYSQYRAVRKKVSWRSLRPGDLVFFRGLGHVGIYVGGGKMVHSPSSGKTVRIVTMKGYYRSSFVGAVRPGG